MKKTVKFDADKFENPYGGVIALIQGFKTKDHDQWARNLQLRKKWAKDLKGGMYGASIGELMYTMLTKSFLLALAQRTDQTPLSTAGVSRRLRW